MFKFLDEDIVGRAPGRLDDRRERMTARPLRRYRRMLGVACALAVAGVAAHSALPPAPAAADATGLPPDLLALAGKMEALQVTSERFSLRTILSFSGPHVPRGAGALSPLLQTQLSGEAVNAPPAGSFTLTLLGHTFRLRLVHGVAYAYEPSIARRDGGRPWVDLGHGPIGSLFGGGVLTAPRGPAGEANSFKTLARALARARSVSELGAGVIDGQAITGFRAMVDPRALEEPSAPGKPSASGPFGPFSSGPFSTARFAPRPQAARVGRGARAPRRPRMSVPLATLEVFIASSGLPVRTRMRFGAEGVALTLLLDVPAINFPLVVHAPPRSETITLAALHRLERARRRGPREDGGERGARAGRG